MALQVPLVLKSLSFFISLILLHVLHTFLKAGVSSAHGATFEEKLQKSGPQGASFWI